jgi:hypothetical protein
MMRGLRDRVHGDLAEIPFSERLSRFGHTIAPVSVILA